MYDIEKNIPLPKSDGRGRSKKYPFDELEIGDSFTVDKWENGARASMIYWSNKTGRRFKSKIDGNKIRFWRIS